jgi:hypothetical protein
MGMAFMSSCTFKDMSHMTFASIHTPYRLTNFLQSTRQLHFINPHIHPQSGTGHMACLANQSLA